MVQHECPGLCRSRSAQSFRRNGAERARNESGLAPAFVSGHHVRRHPPSATENHVIMDRPPQGGPGILPITKVLLCASGGTLNG